MARVIIWLTVKLRLISICAEELSALERDTDLIGPALAPESQPLKIFMRWSRTKGAEEWHSQADAQVHNASLTINLLAEYIFANCFNGIVQTRGDNGKHLFTCLANLEKSGLLGKEMQ